MTDFQNPSPVVVALVPVWSGSLIGLLLVRRLVEPKIGLLALPGGFLENEPWRVGLAREVYEETGLVIQPEHLHALAFESTEPVPNRLLCFADYWEWPKIDEVPSFVPNSEVSQIGLVYRTDGLEDEVAFPLHFAQIREFLEGTDNVQSGAPVGFHPLP